MALGTPPPPPALAMPRHFDFSSDDQWLCCALLFFLCWCPLLPLTDGYRWIMVPQVETAVVGPSGSGPILYYWGALKMANPHQPPITNRQPPNANRQFLK